MGDVAITAANVKHSVAQGQVFRGTLAAGVTVTQGQVLEISNASAVILAKSNATNAPMALGIALNAAAPLQPIDWVSSDPAFVSGGTLTSGDVAWLSNNAGAFTQNFAEVASGSTVIILGVANTDGTLNFSPVIGGTK